MVSRSLTALPFCRCRSLSLSLSVPVSLSVCASFLSVSLSVTRRLSLSRVPLCLSTSLSLRMPMSLVMHCHSILSYTATPCLSVEYRCVVEGLCSLHLSASRETVRLFSALERDCSLHLSASRDAVSLLLLLLSLMCSRLCVLLCALVYVSCCVRVFMYVFACVKTRMYLRVCVCVAGRCIESGADVSLVVVWSLFELFVSLSPFLKVTVISFFGCCSCLSFAILGCSCRRLSLILLQHKIEK